MCMQPRGMHYLDQRQSEYSSFEVLHFNTAVLAAPSSAYQCICKGKASPHVQNAQSTLANSALQHSEYI